MANIGKKSGFSLVELIIVIAIVGILSAIAVPAYKSYSMRANISKAISVLESVKAQSVQYATRHIGLPNAAQLGYPTQFGPIVVTNPHDFSPVIMDLEITPDGTCGKFSIVMIYIQPEYLYGLNSLSIDMDMVFTANGTLETQFFYQATDSNDNIITTDVFPQWHNNGSDAFAAETAFLDTATCQ